MTEFKALTFNIDDRVARITLNRPDAANGLDLVMARELGTVAAQCDGDKAIKAVILSGHGKFFCAGGDLKAMNDYSGQKSLYLKELADTLHRALSTFARMPAPLICAVNGVAAGAGMSMAIFADLVVASDNATFTMAYTRAGLSPDGSASYFLPRIIGLRRTQELMLTNRTLSAQEALDWGLINVVTSKNELMAQAEHLAAKVALGPRQSNATVKKLLLTTFKSGLEEQMEMEGRYIAECSDSEDGREGVQAFIEKRCPQFQ